MLLICLFLITLTTNVCGCSDFQLKTTTGSILCGRNMDFMIPMKSQIMVFNRGTNMSSQAPDGSQGLQWTTKYGFVGINAFAIDLVDEGMNEKGLTCGFLVLNGATYPNVNPDRKNMSLAIMDLCMWVLGNFQSTQEVIENIILLEIWGNKLPVLNIVMGLHVPIHDVYGNNIVIEFMHNNMQIYSDYKLGVLTNEPSLPIQINNLAQYTHLSPNITLNTIINGQSINNGPNSGLHGLPGGWSPMDRFVRIATLVRFVHMTSNIDNALLAATHILDSVYAQDGMEIGYYTPQNTYVSVITRWSTIKDLTNKVFYFRNSDGVIRAVYLEKLIFVEGQHHHTLPIHNNKPFIMDVTYFLNF